MKRWNKLSGIFLLASLMIAPITVNSTGSDDFASREDYYLDFCMQSDLNAESTQKCDRFFEYLSQQNKDMEAELAEITKEQNTIKKDITKVQTSINTLAKQIKIKEAQIAVAQKSINKLQVEITALELKISARELDIEKRHTTIRTRMEAVQSLMATNAFADFVMGAKNFVDLIRRVEGVGDITSYDKQQIRDLEAQKTLLMADKQDLSDQKKMIEDKKREMEEAKTSLQKAKNQQEIFLKEYRMKEAQLEAARQKAAQNLSEVKKALSDLSSLKDLKPSAGWKIPVKNFKVSAGSWYYPASFCASGANSCVHLGLDLSAGVGSPIYAPIEGIILYVHDKCPTYGGLGNWCGTPGSAGAGNHILLVGQVKDKTFAIKFAHMQNGISKYIRWPSPDGKAIRVLQGQQLGNMGSSGNSSGPHTHIEIMYFGTAKVESVINTFKAKGQFDFGLGWGNAGLNTTCNKKGFVAPCRYRPEEIFNVSIGKSY